MTNDVTELVRTLSSIVWLIGGLLVAYVFTRHVAWRMKRRYEHRVRDVEQSLIGCQVLVIQTVGPGQSGTIAPLGPDADERHRAYARDVLWAGQRARVTARHRDGYLIAPLGTRQTINAERGAVPGRMAVRHG